MGRSGWKHLCLALPVAVAAGACLAVEASTGTTALAVGLAGHLPLSWALWRCHRRPLMAPADAPAEASAAEQDAERTQAFIQRLIDVIPDPVYIKRRGGHYAMVNDAFADYHGLTKAQVIAGGLSQPLAAPHTRALSLQEDERILAGGEVWKEEHTARRSTGEEVFRIVCKRPSVYVDGDAVVVGIDHHITRWRVAERELKTALEREVALRLRTERFVQDLIDVLPDAVYLKDEHSRYVMVNDAAARLRGMSKQQLVGLDSLDLAPQPQIGHTSMIEDQAVLAGDEIVKEERAILPVTGEECFRIVIKRRCFDVDGRPVVVAIQHYTTEWRQAERELRRLAQEDALTGIANRRHIAAELGRAMQAAVQQGQPLSLLLLDVDLFKRVNDRHGHNVGDQVLVEVASRCAACLQAPDLVGRWGGEEFVVLVHGDLARAQAVGERLRRAMVQTLVPTSDGVLAVTISGGCAQLRPGEGPESLVGRADQALYRAKQGGRNRVLAELAAPAQTVAEAQPLPG